MLTPVERAAKFQAALEICQHLHTEMCRADFNDVSKELTDEMTDLVIKMTYMHDKLKKQSETRTVKAIPYTVEMDNYCTACGCGIPNGSRFCHNCGRKIKEGEN